MPSDSGRDSTFNSGRIMKNRFVSRVAWGIVLATLLPIAAAQAQYVRLAPPPPVIERPYAAPGPGYRWVPGYHRWDGRRYIWTGGRWVVPPRPRAVWETGRWDRSPYGYHWRPGRWRY